MRRSESGQGFFENKMERVFGNAGGHPREGWMVHRSSPLHSSGRWVVPAVISQFLARDDTVRTAGMMVRTATPRVSHPCSSRTNQSCCLRRSSTLLPEDPSGTESCFNVALSRWRSHVAVSDSGEYPDKFFSSCNERRLRMTGRQYVNQHIPQ